MRHRQTDSSNSSRSRGICCSFNGDVVRVERERVQRDGGRWGGRLRGAACYLGTPHTHPATHRSAPKGTLGAAATMAIGKEERAVWKMGVTCNKQKPNKNRSVTHPISPYGQIQSFNKWQLKIGNVSWNSQKSSTYKFRASVLVFFFVLVNCEIY